MSYCWYIWELVQLIDSNQECLSHELLDFSFDVFAPLAMLFRFAHIEQYLMRPFQGIITLLNCVDHNLVN